MIENNENSSLSVFCDESCHLEFDDSKVMILGAIWLPSCSLSEINRDIKLIKLKYNRSPNYEIKWTKLYKGNIDLALELVDYFFNSEALHFRACIIDKTNLNHDFFHQSHDTWYFKMYYTMLKQIVIKNRRMDVFIDIKDSNSGGKIAGLSSIIKNFQKYRGIDLNHKYQIIRSHESQVMQLVDLFIGAIRYVNQGLATSSTKQLIVDSLITHTGLNLCESTPIYSEKFNIFVWDSSYFLRER